MPDTTAPRWLLFAASLSGRSASTPRVRLWRALKERGAATLRDGVTLLPATAAHFDALKEIGAQVESEGGSSWLFELAAQAPPTEERLSTLFDRSEGYAGLRSAIIELQAESPQIGEATARRRVRQLEREFEAIVGIDFFPGEARARSRQTLEAVIASLNRRYSPAEPSKVAGEVRRLDRSGFQGRSWATRKRLWVDRAASAWLIRRFVDTQAQFIWLERPEDCPDDALGFDFDGASFTHVGERVTFEVLLASFGLEADPGLVRLGRLVHYLDVGGEPVAEAAGFEAVMAGLRESAPNDDALLAAMAPVLNALHRRFSSVET